MKVSRVVSRGRGCRPGTMSRAKNTTGGASALHVGTAHLGRRSRGVRVGASKDGRGRVGSASWEGRRRGQMLLLCLSELHRKQRCRRGHCAVMWRSVPGRSPQCLHAGRVVDGGCKVLDGVAGVGDSATVGWARVGGSASSAVGALCRMIGGWVLSELGRSGTEGGAGGWAWVGGRWAFGTRAGQACFQWCRPAASAWWQMGHGLSGCGVRFRARVGVGAFGLTVEREEVATGTAVGWVGGWDCRAASCDSAVSSRARSSRSWVCAWCSADSSSRMRARMPMGDMSAGPTLSVGESAQAAEIDGGSPGAGAGGGGCCSGSNNNGRRKSETERERGCEGRDRPPSKWVMVVDGMGLGPAVRGPKPCFASIAAMRGSGLISTERSTGGATRQQTCAFCATMDRMECGGHSGGSKAS